MPAPKNSNESYCTFTLASDVTAGGLPSEEEIAKDLESNDQEVCTGVSFATVTVNDHDWIRNGCGTARLKSLYSV